MWYPNLYMTEFYFLLANRISVVILLKCIWMNEIEYKFDDNLLLFLFETGLK